MKTKPDSLYVVETKPPAADWCVMTHRGVFIDRNGAVANSKHERIPGWRYRVTRYDSTRGK